MYSLHLTHPKWTHTRSSGQPCYSSVPCSRTPQSWYWRRTLPQPTIPAGPEIRTHNLLLTSPTRYPLGHDCPIWAAMSSAGVGPLCFLKSTVNAAIYQEILEHFMLPSADKLYGDADFIFQQDLAPAHTAKGTKSWFNDHGVTVLDWPANSPDLNLIENLWGIVKRKMRDTRPNNADELKATVKETWASIPPQQCHKLITSMPRRIEAVIKAKGAPTKYWVHIQ